MGIEHAGLSSLTALCKTSTPLAAPQIRLFPRQELQASKYRSKHKQRRGWVPFAETGGSGLCPAAALERSEARRELVGLGSPAGSWVTESHPQQMLRQRRERREEAAASELVIPFALKTPSVVCPESLQLARKEPNSLQVQWPRGFGKGTRFRARWGSFSSTLLQTTPSLSATRPGPGRTGRPGNAASPRQTTPRGAPFPRVATCTWAVLARG